MKYLALLSGGKDSCYNLVHCTHNGHELVAAASLGPEPGKEELDSYLYQTVGQDAIELVAQALEIPLYRRVITGYAVEQGSEYNTSHAGGIAGDETEDLYELLLKIKTLHPDVKGVSVGAILSNYQRVRVEHVCRRLDLTPLCFLWQRDQAELLDEMIEAGMDAILIKVAGIGLTTSHLGKTLADMKNILLKLNTLYGLHVCGEGGEYESLTLDCPLFKHRIKITESEIVIHSNNSFASVAFLRIKAAELEPKTGKALKITIPSLLEDEYLAVQSSVLLSQRVISQDSSSFDPPTCISTMPLAASKRKNSWVAISNVQISTLVNEDGFDIDIEEEVALCFHRLAESLSEYGLLLCHCAYINIFLSSMDLFSKVNAVYARFFGTSPPARACVGVDLCNGTRVKLDCFAFDEANSFDRKALHVQGLSYWAPANIGPYSQAIAINERIFISGQIGLIPSHMALPNPRSLATELGLASQHAARVTNAIKESCGLRSDGNTQLAIYWLTELKDVCHVKQGHLALKDFNFPVLFLVIKELPKGALVEKQMLYHTGRCAAIDDGEVILEPRIPELEDYYIDFKDGCVLHWQLSKLGVDSSCAVIFVKGDPKKVQEGMKADMTSIFACALSARLFYSSYINTSVQTLTNIMFAGLSIPPVTPIPCRVICSTRDGYWDFAICIVT